MRELSVQFLGEIFAEATGATPVVLMRIEITSNMGVTSNLYFCQNSVAITSNGIVYQPAAFNVALGKDINNEVPTVSLSFDAGDRGLITQLRELNKPPKFYISVVVAERPNIVEFAEVEYQLTNWTINETLITMSLQVEPILNEPIPADRVTPLTAPSLWNNITVDNTGVPRPPPLFWQNYDGSPTTGDPEIPPEYPSVLE